MLIDTHCHLDAGEFDGDRERVWAHARASGVARVVIPAVARDNFAVVRDLAHGIDGGTYALGIHPLFVARADEGDLACLREAVIAALPDPRFVAIGEIGLDFFVESISSGAPRTRQEHFYETQLKLAAEFGLPVLLHVRRSQDILLKYLRRIDVPGGIAHAFNGSRQQADLFVQRGFALGLGGEMTYERSRNIRRLAEGMPLDALVLETDAPDIPPAWLPRDNRRNAPFELPRVAQVLARLRGLDEAEVADATTANAMRVLPRLNGPLASGRQPPRAII